MFFVRVWCRDGLANACRQRPLWRSENWRESFFSASGTPQRAFPTARHRSRRSPLFARTFASCSRRCSRIGANASKVLLRHIFGKFDPPENNNLRAFARKTLLFLPARFPPASRPFIDLCTFVPFVSVPPFSSFILSPSSFSPRPHYLRLCYIGYRRSGGDLVMTPHADRRCQWNHPSPSVVL